MYTSIRRRSNEYETPSGISREEKSLAQVESEETVVMVVVEKREDVSCPR